MRLAEPSCYELMVIAARRQIMYTLIKVVNVHRIGQPLLSFRHELPKQVRITGPSSMQLLSRRARFRKFRFVIINVEYRFNELMFPIRGGRSITL